MLVTMNVLIASSLVDGMKRFQYRNIEQITINFFIDYDNRKSVECEYLIMDTLLLFHLK